MGYIGFMYGLYRVYVWVIQGSCMGYIGFMYGLYRVHVGVYRVCIACVMHINCSLGWDQGRDP